MYNVDTSYSLVLDKYNVQCTCLHSYAMYFVPTKYLTPTILIVTVRRCCNVWYTLTCLNVYRLSIYYYQPISAYLHN